MITQQKLKGLSQDIWSMSTKDPRIQWNKLKNSFYYRDHTGKFPTTVFLQSSKTGKTVVFMLDAEKALENEFWDGEEFHMKACPSTNLDCNFIITRGQ